MTRVKCKAKSQPRSDACSRILGEDGNELDEREQESSISLIFEGRRLWLLMKGLWCGVAAEGFKKDSVDEQGKECKAWQSCSCLQVVKVRFPLLTC